ncbi:MAG: rod shape-determining protein MreC [Candidatus Levybacteria bacterium]|nr:rod shape-determining protein MreC [Candidatus Levybacteria bacterium]
MAKASWFENVRGVFESTIKPMQRIIFSLTQMQQIFFDKEKDELRREIASLQKKIVDQKQLEKEVIALKDQFQTNNPNSKLLLPANILGMPRFIPGISAPSIFILDAGEEDKIRIGQVVVFKDNVVGKVTKVSERFSVVTLITDPSLSFSAQTVGGVLGVVKGQGGDLVFENVLASEDLRVGEIVVIKDPPNLIVGKIISVDKTQSSLFQSAQVESVIDFSKVSTVFVVMSNQ